MQLEDAAGREDEGFEDVVWGVEGQVVGEVRGGNCGEDGERGGVELDEGEDVGWEAGAEEVEGAELEEGVGHVESVEGGPCGCVVLALVLSSGGITRALTCRTYLFVARN